MAKYNAGVRFNAEVAKYMFLEYDTSTGTCIVHVEGINHGEVLRLKSTILPNMWEIED